MNTTEGFGDEQALASQVQADLLPPTMLYSRYRFETIRWSLEILTITKNNGYCTLPIVRYQHVGGQVVCLDSISEFFQKIMVRCIR